MKESINQSIKQSTNQTINQSINESINQSMNQSIITIIPQSPLSPLSLLVLEKIPNNLIRPSRNPTDDYVSRILELVTPEKRVKPPL